jgi:hypothetical protein
MRFMVPSATREGPNMISSSEPTGSKPTRSPRGSWACVASLPQWKPRPGASTARASGEPIITASAPQATALAMSPELPMEPSAITWT